MRRRWPGELAGEIATPRAPTAKADTDTGEMSSEGGHPDVTQAAKVALRTRLLRTRSARSSADLVAAGVALAAAVRAMPDLPPVVACYLSVGAEPPTSPLLDVLHDRGVRLLVPVLRADADLDWVSYLPGDPVRDGLRGTIEPATRGDGSLQDAALILLPALAVDSRGHRLGRGGGSYDRALTRRNPTSELVAVVFDDEVLGDVPAAAHDVLVGGVLTPTGRQRLR